MAATSYTELAKKFDDLNVTVMSFIASQAEYNKDICRHETSIHGNGKQGMLTTLEKLDGRLVQLEKMDGRRQKLVDYLVAALVLMALIEILRLVAANI